MGPTLEIVILSGGKSSRMGRDKGLMLLAGRPMVQYVINAAQKTGYLIRIVANDLAYKQFGYPVISDIVPEKGPMGGLYTALATSQARYVLLLSCDTPMITNVLLQFLVASLTDTEILVAADQGKLYPTLAIYQNDLAPAVLSCIRSEQLKMQHFIRSRNHQMLDVNNFTELNPEILVNINTLESLNELEKNAIW